MLLLAIVDARGRFMYANVGSPGSCGDSGVWNRSRFKRKRVDAKGLLRTPAVPVTCTDAGTELTQTIMPFLVGDGAFAPNAHMQKCYPDHDKSYTADVFNRALCDTRKVVEMAFGRLKMKWQFCHNNVWHNDPVFVRLCIMVCCCLHNFCMEQSVTHDDELLATHVEYTLNEAARNGNAGAVGGADAQGTESSEQIRDFLAAVLG